MIKKFNLQMFAEGGDGGSVAGTAEGNQNTQAVGNLGSRASKNPLANVVYGKQDTIPAENGEGQTETRAADDRKAQWRQMIKGDYKDLFTESTQSIIDKRFKETKALESFQKDISPVIAMLNEKYGTKDVQSLMKAIDDDTSWWERQAEREGLTVEQLKQKQRLESENKQFKQLMEMQQREQAAQRQYNAWLQEEDSVKAVYPNFNLAYEADNNPEFIRMLSLGVPMQHAYEVSHIDEIKQGVATTAQTVVANTVRANGMRPSENASSAQTGIVSRADVRNLTKADRAEIARRAQQGETIIF